MDISAISSATEQPAVSAVVSATSSPQRVREVDPNLVLDPSKEELLRTLRANNPISKEELSEARSAIDTQDKIISALEKDNEKLHRENKALAVNVRDADRALNRAEAKITLQQTAPTAANPEFTHETHEALSQKVKELHTQLEQSHINEEELRVHVDTLKKEKKNLEHRLAQVDPAQIDQAALESRHAKVQMQRAQLEHDGAMEDMIRKVAWYVEHQESNRAQEDLIKEQQHTIHELRMSLADAEAARRLPTTQSEKDKRIRLLERMVAELEENIRERNPNSIPEMIRACRPTHNETTHSKRMQARIDTLEAQLKEVEDNAHRTIERLRVEADAVKMQYQERMTRVEEEMKAKLVQVQSKKVKELEKTLVETRRFYTEKVKDLEHTLLALRRQAGPGAASAAAAARRGRTLSNSPGQRKEELDRAKEGEQPQGSEDKEKEQQATAPSLGGLRGGDLSAVAQLGAFQQLQLQQQLELSRVLRERDELTLKLREEEQKNRLVATEKSQSTNEMELLKKENAALATSNAQLRESHSHWDHRLRQLVEDNKRGVESMRQQFLGELTDTRQHYEKEIALLKDTQKAFDFLQPNLATAAFLGTGTGGGERGGSDMQSQVRGYLKMVAERLRAIEQQQVAREQDMQSKFEEVKRIAEYEITVEKQRMELVVQQKNNEIRQFQMQLDTLLNDIAMLQQRQRGGGVDFGAIPAATAAA